MNLSSLLGAAYRVADPLLPLDAQLDPRFGDGSQTSPLARIKTAGVPATAPRLGNQQPGGPVVTDPFSGTLLDRAPRVPVAASNPPPVSTAASALAPQAPPTKSVPAPKPAHVSWLRVLDGTLGGRTLSQSYDAEKLRGQMEAIAASIKDPAEAMQFRMNPAKWVEFKQHQQAAAQIASDLDHLLGGQGRQVQAPSPAPAPSASSATATVPPPAAAPGLPHSSAAPDPAVVRTVIGEAGGEGRDGQRAVMEVILNRAQQTGLTPAEVVAQPRQFSGYTAERVQGLQPGDPEYDAVAANIADAQPGAYDHFYAPALANPAWAQGRQGVDIGGHRFLALNDQRRVRQSVDQAGPVADTPFFSGRDVVPADAPPPPPPASALQTGPALQGVTPEQVAFAKRLLLDPTTYEQGVAYATKLQEEAAKPVQYQNATVNGAPARFNSLTGQYELVPMDGARTRVEVASQGGPYVAGTVLKYDAMGNPTVVDKPSDGYERVNGRTQYVRGGKEEPAAGANLVAGERQLRDEYAGKVKDYQEARNGFQKVATAAKDGTGASDIALIFGFMKTLDPGSTIREGEFATAQNSGNISQTVQNMYNKAIKGERLTPEQRAMFVHTAEQQFGVYQQQFDATNARYTQIAQAYGYDPSRIIAAPAPAKAPAAKPAPRKGDASSPARSGPPSTAPRKASAPSIPAGAVSDLKADPSPQARAEFDEVFGKGAAARVLGGR